MDILVPGVHCKTPSPGKDGRRCGAEEGGYLPGVRCCRLSVDPPHPGVSVPRPRTGAAALSADTHPSQSRQGGESWPGLSAPPGLNRPEPLQGAAYRLSIC